MKLILSLILLLLLYNSLLIAQTLDEHKVIIHVLDSMSNPMTNVKFEITGQGNLPVAKAVSNNDGLFEINLNKGKQYQIKFYDTESESLFNFRVPTDTRLKAYRVLCRLPLLTGSNPKKKNPYDITGDERTIPVMIVIQNKDLLRLRNQEFELYSSDKSLNKKCVTDETGSFKTELMEKYKYNLKTTISNEEFNDSFIVPANVKNYTFKLILPYPPVSSPDIPTQSSINKYLRTFTLQNVNFATGSWELNPSSYPYLDELVKELLAKPEMVIEIAGHTDDVGKDEDNMVLSQRRAESVYNYLVEKNIESERLSAIGYGETAPIETNKTPEGRAANRRIEVRVIKE